MTTGFQRCPACSGRVYESVGFFQCQECGRRGLKREFEVDDAAPVGVLRVRSGEVEADPERQVPGVREHDEEYPYGGGDAGMRVRGEREG